MATKKIKVENHKNHIRSESSRKNQPVGEKNQNQNQLGISKENLPLVIIYIAFYMKLIWVPSLTSWPNERMKLPLVLICMGFDRKLIFDVTARRAIKKLLGFKESWHYLFFSRDSNPRPRDSQSSMLSSTSRTSIVKRIQENITLRMTLTTKFIFSLNFSILSLITNVWMYRYNNKHNSCVFPYKICRYIR